MARDRALAHQSAVCKTDTTDYSGIACSYLPLKNCRHPMLSIKSYFTSHLLSLPWKGLFTLNE